MNTHQITSVLLLSLKHMMRNCLPSVLIILSLSSSAFIFILCVSLINGINSNVDSSDSLKNSFVVYRKGSDNEMGSYISRDELLALQSLELSGTGKRSRFFGELATIVTSPKSDDDMQSGNLTLRGIESSALPARGITLING